MLTPVGYPSSRVAKLVPVVALGMPNTVPVFPDPMLVPDCIEAPGSADVAEIHEILLRGLPVGADLQVVLALHPAQGIGRFKEVVDFIVRRGRLPKLWTLVSKLLTAASPWSDRRESRTSGNRRSTVAGDLGARIIRTVETVAEFVHLVSAPGVGVAQHRVGPGIVVRRNLLD